VVADAAPKRRDSEATREAIFEAAREVFIASGYNGASIRKVAKQAGYTHGTIYLYFRDKDDLLYQLSEEHFRQLLTRLRALPRTLEPVTRLREALRTILHFGLEYPDHYHLMVSMRPPHLASSAQRFGPMAEEVSGLLFDVVTRAAERGGFRLDNPRIEANGLLALVHGLIEFHRSEVLERAIDLMLAGMAKERPGP
jgi:AcrR family transcriptional regulator